MHEGAPPTNGAAPSVDPDPGSSWTPSDTARVVVAAITFVASTAIAVRGTSSLEADLVMWLNGQPDWLHRPVWLVMQLGTVGLAAVVGLGVGLTLRRPLLAVVFAITPVIAWFAARVVKDVVERGRPAAEGLAVTIRGPADAGFGFVSGHSAVAFALATVVSPYLPGRWRIVPFALATVVALARPYVGAHLALDVVGGAAVGILVAEAVRAAEVLLTRRDRHTPRTVGRRRTRRIRPR